MWKKTACNTKTELKPIMQICILKDTLTQRAQLTDDVGKRDVSHTLKFTFDTVGQCLAAQMPGLNVPRHQWHNGEWSGRPAGQKNTYRFFFTLEEDISFIQHYQCQTKQI